MMPGETMETTTNKHHVMKLMPRVEPYAAGYPLEGGIKRPLPWQSVAERRVRLFRTTVTVRTDL
jgi:hypothetical protein